MAGYKDIIGHEQMITHFKNAVSQDKVSHAYIINGPDGSGKMMLAEAFATALQCEQAITSRTLFIFPMRNRIRYLWMIFENR